MYIVSPYHYLPLWQNLANFLFIISNVFWLDFCFLYGIFTTILYLRVALTEKVWDRFLCSICVCSHWCSLFLMYKMFILLCKPTLLFSFLRLEFYLLRFFFFFKCTTLMWGKLFTITGMSFYFTFLLSLFVYFVDSVPSTFRATSREHSNHVSGK